MDTRQVVVRGVRSPVAQDGASEATEAVLFIHGNPGSAQDWDFAIPSVAEFARVIAPDMPGYGSADRPRDLPYTVKGYADHLAGILAQLDVSRVHLVLHDFGGPWGLQWAVDNPQALASVTLIDTGVFPDYRWHKFAKVWRTPILGELFKSKGVTHSNTELMVIVTPIIVDPVNQEVAPAAVPLIPQHPVVPFLNPDKFDQGLPKGAKK